MIKKRIGLILVSSFLAVSSLVGCSGEAPGESSSGSSSPSSATPSGGSSQDTYYTIRWYNGDELLETDSVKEGIVPTYNGQTPSKKGGQTGHIYTFNGWDPAVSQATSNRDYHATYTDSLQSFTITWDVEGTKTTESYDYGTTPRYKGDTPTKAPTSEIQYVFDGWEPAVSSVTSNQTYTAKFRSEPRKYSVKWVVDGKEKAEQYECGETPFYMSDDASYNPETELYEPVKASTEEYSYSFLRWEPSISVVSEDVTYEAVFTSSKNIYTVNWYDGDYSLLDSKDYEYGETPEYTGETPTKESDREHDYTFSNWSPEMGPVTGDIDYYPEFSSSARKYIVTWVVNDVEIPSEYYYGETPDFGEDPQMPPDEQYEYTFTGWYPNITSVDRDVTYTAQFSREVKTYDITFIEKNGSVVKEYAYGVTPNYVPSNVEEDEYIYVFSGFEEEVVPVSGKATYTAKYNKIDKASYEALTFQYVSDRGYEAVLSSGSTITDLIIPSYYEGKPVIRASGLSGNTSLVNVTLPNSITNMPSFNNCTNLETVNIPTGVREVQIYYTFVNCNNLQYTIEDGIKYLASDSNDYYLATGLANGSEKDVVVLNELTECINDRAFDSTKIGEFHYYPGVKYIGERAFDNAKIGTCNYHGDMESHFAIKYNSNISSPESVAKVFILNGEEVVDLVIPEGISEISDHAFYGIKSIKSVVISSSETKLGKYAFDLCENLVSVTLPNGLESIPSYCFCACSSLLTITIPESVTSISDYAFYNCKSLYEVVNKSALEITAGNTDYGYVAYYAKDVISDEADSKLINKDGFILYAEDDEVILLKYIGDAKELVVPEEVTIINDNAIAYNSTVESLKLGQNITYIGKTAFKDCTMLKSVYWDVKSCNDNGYYYDYWFSGCTNLELVEFGDNVEAIPQEILLNSSVKTIIISDSVKKIGNSAFEDCKNLSLVIVGSGLEEEGSQVYKNTPTNITILSASSVGTATMRYDGEGTIKLVDNQFIVLVEDDVTYLLRYYGNSEEVVIPDDIDYIGAPESMKEAKKAGFYGSNIKSVTLGANVKTIGVGAFTLCENLETIIFNDVIEVIDGSAFYQCYALTSIVIPDTVTTIGNSAFYWCKSLTDVTIGKGVTSIGYSAFGKCANINLTFNAINIENWGKYNAQYNEYYLPFDETAVVSITIGDGVKIIPTCFMHNKGITAVVIPDSVETIGDNAFDAGRLASVTIGKNVTTIGMYAFSGTIITSVEIPGSVKSIGYGAFYWCEQLEEVIFHEGLESIGDRAFDLCCSLTSIELPDSLVTIGEEAFRGDSSNTGYMSLANVKLGKGVKNIGDYAFAYNSHLKSFTMYDGVENIGSRILYRSDSINGNAFDGLKFLGNDENPYVYLYKTGFGNCRIPASCKIFGEDVFSNASSGYTVYYDGTLEDWCKIKVINEDSNPMLRGKLFYILDAAGDVEYDGNKYSLLSELIIPDTVTEIGDYQFYGTKADKIVVHGGVTHFGKYCFYNNKATTIVLEEGITAIDSEYAFGYSLETVNIVIPKTLESVADYNLKGYYSSSELKLENIYYGGDFASYYNIKFGDNSNPLDSEAYKNFYIADEDGDIEFEGRKYSKIKELVINAENIFKFSSFFEDLEKVYFDGTIEDWCNIDFSNVKEKGNPMNYASEFYILDEEGTVEKYGKKYSLLTEVVIPESITEIGAYQFYEFNKIKKVVLHEGVTTIGDYAFYLCEALQEINLDKVSSIGVYAFYNDDALTELDLSAATSIGAHAFFCCDGFVEVELTNVNSLGDYAFSKCINLKTATLGDELLAIGENTFNDCGNLTTVNLGNSITSIGYSAFGYCSSLTAIELPDTLLTIANYAFNGCDKLNEIVIPDSVTTIGYSAFQYCQSIYALTIGASVTTINDSAFYNCSGIYEVINKSALEIVQGETSNGYAGYYAKSIVNSEDDSKISHKDGFVIYDNTTLISYKGTAENVVIPDGITVIASGVFNDNSTMKTVKIPEGVEKLDSYTFTRCKALKEIVIPASVTEIAMNAITYCSALEYVYIPDTVATIKQYALYSNDRAVVYCEPAIKSSTDWNSYFAYIPGEYGGMTNTIIWNTPADHERIIIDGFEYVINSDGTSVAIVNYIGSDKDVTIPNTIEYNSKNYLVKNLKQGAFHNNTKVETLIIGANITTLNQDSLVGMTSLKWVYIPSTVTSIGQSPFDSYQFLTVYDGSNRDNHIAWTKCTRYVGGVSLEDLHFEDGDFEYYIDSLGNATLVNYRGSEKDIVIPNTVTYGEKTYKVTKIGEMVFGVTYNYYKKINSVMVGENVTSIGYRAFYYQDKLTKVVLGDNITSIGDDAFRNCNKLAEINIPANLETIGQYAFNYCESLAGITLNNKLTSIGSSAFENAKLKTIHIPSNVTKMGSYVFYNSSVIIFCAVDSIPSGWIENWNGSATVFWGVGDEFTPTLVDGLMMYSENPGELTIVAYFGDGGDVVIPDMVGENKVVSIYKNVFYNNRTITSLTLGKYLREIGNNAFYYCTNLVTVNAGDALNKIGENAFSYCDALKEFKMTGEDNVEYLGKYAFNYSKNLEEIGFGAKLISLGDYALASTAIKEFVSTSTLTTLGRYTFSSCTALNSVVLGENVLEIPEACFYGCLYLKSFRYLGELTSIGDNAFYRNEYLDPIYIPDSVTKIGNNAFYLATQADNRSLIYCEATEKPSSWNSSWVNSYVQVFWGVDKDAVVQVDDFEYLLTSDNTATVMKYYGTDSTVVIPDVIEVNEKEYKVTEINVRALYYQPGITVLTIGNNVEKIDEGAFHYCFNINKVNMGKSVKKISAKAFYYCYNISTFNYSGTVAEWEVVDLETNWNQYASSLKTITCSDGEVTL